MTVYEHGDEILVVDAGLAFPRDEHLGVDLVLPDISYLEGKRVNAVVLTPATRTTSAGCRTCSARSTATR